MSKAAFLFPGQGAQESGMGKDFYENFEVAKNTFNSIDNILGRRISDLCFFGSDEELKDTKNTQAALLAVSVVGLEVLKSELDITPSYLAGHSLGEYGALFASGALNLENSFKLIQARANFMAECAKNSNGSMAAIIGLAADETEHAVSEIDNVYVANYNEPKQTVITGDKEKILYACDVLKSLGARRAIPLTVSGAFHSPYMKSAGEKFQEFIKNIEIFNAEIPVITNVDAEITTNAEDFRKKEVKQIFSSVQWTKTIQKMLDNGVDTFIEIGQGRVLSGLVKKIATTDVKILNISNKETLINTIEELK